MNLNATTHELKIWPEYFKEVRSGVKNFELRLDDRQYRAGDNLVLREWAAIPGAYTGEYVRRRITYVLRNAPGLQNGYVVLGMKKLPSLG